MIIISSCLVSQALTHTLLCQVRLCFLQTLFQEADISGCGGILKSPGEAESSSFLLRLHGCLVQEEVGIDVVNLRRMCKTQMKAFPTVVVRQMIVSKSTRCRLHIFSPPFLRYF